MSSGNPHRQLPSGLHESVVTRELAETLSHAGLSTNLAAVDKADAAHVLTRHVAAQVMRRLMDVKEPEHQLQIVNALLSTLKTDDQIVVDPLRELHEVRSPDPAIGMESRSIQRPATPLNDAALLTNAKGDPSLAAELRKELTSADSVDLLCAFVMWRGVRLLEKELSEVARMGVPFRVLTTTYIGGTEREALDRLVKDFGAQVRIQYDATRTRLHAKAWLFRRRTGFDTAYVGSSNLSTAALLDGVEWNVRLSTGATPALMTKFAATFDSYWNSSGFEAYNPDTDADRLDDALLEATGKRRRDPHAINLSGLEVRPYPFQQEMLEAIEAERVIHNRHRNLVVAATGTGKTVVAALDYRGLVDANGGVRPSLLFVAHRHEILEQSLRTYREVLGDADFGGLFVGGTRPDRWDHVFASVQSLSTRPLDAIPHDRWQIVVIDEFHHANAATYRRLLNHLTPRELLGLTATPERTDGVDVREFFGGRTAAELRLWDALDGDLLSPFHYFGVADGTDLRRVLWTRGRYDEKGLEALYTGNDARSRIVLSQVRDKVADPRAMRALGFCVGVDHAAYMARVFRDAGIPALAVSGATPACQRSDAITALRTRDVNIIFSADLFNEGLDVPEVDTLLMLRPTQSATIFLQQLGRGLRRTRDKAVTTVLDFVGHHRAEFDFGERLRAMTGNSRAELRKQVAKDFPFLPSGSQIVLDRQTKSLVLSNIQSQLAARWPAMVKELRALGEVDLDTFLKESELELSDVLRQGKKSWTDLRRAAGLPTPDGSALESNLLKRIRAVAHVDDPERARAYGKLLDNPTTPYEDLSPLEQRFARMLYYSMWPDGGGFAWWDNGYSALAAEGAVREELSEVIELALDRTRHISFPMAMELQEIPLRVHAAYQREEILSALDFPRRPNSFREGVWFSPELNIDVFFVTLKKSEADYSPSTMYRDYAINAHLFHWESQSTTSVTSKTGSRYLSGSSTVLIFARHEQKNEFGTSPYLFLGPATYVSHTGDKPIAITWKLQHAMPADFFQVAAAVAP